MNQKHTELLEFLRGIQCKGMCSPRLVAACAGFMVNGIHDHEGLWQQAQDAYGDGAEGLMDMIASHATWLAHCWDALTHIQHRDLWGHLVDIRQDEEETKFVWAVVERFGSEMARLVCENPTVDLHALTRNHLHVLIATWLVGPLYPAGARWYVELVNSTEGFYATTEDPVEALQQTLSYYNLTDAALIRKIERVQENNHGQ
jgi:hypothetical protein